MKIIILDTETTGLPKTKILNNDSLSLWPYIVQLSYIIYDTELKQILKISDFIVRIPETINISKEVSNIHGITNEISQNSLHIINDALEQLCNDYFNYDVELIIGHNLSFDINMIKVELMRVLNSNILDLLCKKMFSMFLSTLEYDVTNKLYCTMQKSIELCNLKMKSKFGKEYLKFPKLNELHIQLFNSSPRNLHNSLNDVLICLRCYYMLEHKIDIIKIDDKVKNLLIELI